MTLEAHIWETDWVEAQANGHLPWYSPTLGFLFEKKGVHPGHDFRRTNPIKRSGQKLTHIHSAEMFGRDEVVHLRWTLDYAGRCPKCGGVMHVFTASVYGIPDSGYDVEQCYDCGYYE